MGESVAKKGGVSVVKEGPDVGTGLTCCSVRSVQKEEIQLLKEDRMMNSVSTTSGVTMFLRPVSAGWILGKDQTLYYVRSRYIKHV